MEDRSRRSHVDNDAFVTPPSMKNLITSSASASYNNNNFNSQTSVGNRLRTWVSSVFSEMRQRSPALKKWVDFKYAATNTTTSPSSDDFQTTKSVQIDRKHSFGDQQLTTPKKKLSVIELTGLCRSTQELCKNVPPIVITKSEGNLSTSVGQLRIEELHSKLQVNRLQYELLRRKRLKVQKLLQSTLSTMDGQQQQDLDSLEFSFDDTFAHKSGAGNSDDDLYSTKLARSSTLKTDSRCVQYSLADIGRRFSEIVDEPTSDFELNESNNSCPNSSSLLLNSLGHQQRRDSDKLLLEASLVPLRAQSVPASPLPKLHKKYLKRDASLSSDSPRTHHQLLRDSSFQSDSSHRSSVESLLDARKPDPEIILANLGFGPAQTEDVVTKIPKRFLRPSQVRGVDTEQFLRQQQVAMTLHENSVLGYRGLIGNPHIPPSNIVAKILERFKCNDKPCDILNES